MLVGLAIIALAFFAAADPRPRALRVPVLRPRRDPVRGLAALAHRVRVLSLATFLNMYVVLTTFYPPDDPSQPGARLARHRRPVRSELGVALVALLHTAASVWAWFQLRASVARTTRRGGHDRAAARRERRHRIGRARVAGWTDVGRGPAPAGLARLPVTPISRSGAPVGDRLAARGATLPTWSDRPSLDDVGLPAGSRDRLRAAPFRADRTAPLRREGGGRLDRLDVWLLVVVLLSTFGLRLFRLAEPYQMHFDEVYHARTATEFLQYWRYGEEHDIYEWTHPHLAKYAMAAGLVLWGGDHVASTSDLGTTVRAVAIEHRRAATDPGSAAGGRVYVATQTGILAEDLQTRAPVATIDAPGITALAIDETGARLVAADGRARSRPSISTRSGRRHRRPSL